MPRAIVATTTSLLIGGLLGCQDGTERLPGGTPDDPPEVEQKPLHFAPCGLIGDGGAEVMAYAPDGALLAVAGRGALQVLRGSDGTVVRRFEDVQSPAYATALAFSSDGATLFSGNTDGKLRAWRVSDGALLRTTEAHTGAITSISCAADVVATVAHEESVKLWRAADGTALRTLPDVSPLVLALSPDAATLATGGDPNAGVVELRRVADGGLLWSKRLFRSGVIAIAFSPDGATIATGSQERGGLRLWRAADGTPIREPAQDVYEGPVPAVAFSADGATAASAQPSTKEIHTWRVSDGARLAVASDLEVSAAAIAFAPGGGVLASGDPGGPVRFWRLGQEVLMPEGAATRRSSAGPVVFSPDGTMIATGDGSPDGTRSIRLWSTSDWTPLRDLPGGAEPRAFSRDGSTLAGVAHPNTSRLEQWRVGDGAAQAIGGDMMIGGALAFSPDGQLVANAWREVVELRRTSDGSLVRELTFGPGGMYAHALSLAFSADGTALAAGEYREGSDQRATVWRVADGARLRELSWDGGYAYSVAFSPDGTLLATGYSADRTRVWRLSDGALAWQSTIRGHGDSLIFSPDGTLLAGGNAPSNVNGAGTIQIWRASDGAPIQALTGHGITVSSIAFAPDGRKLAGAGDHLRVWCLE